VSPRDDLRRRVGRPVVLGVATLVAALGWAVPASAQDDSDLAKAAQNPVADLISLPLQNNVLFGVGPGNDVANVLNIQPVIPFKVGPVNLINRSIIPLVYLPDLTAGLPGSPGELGGSVSEFGLGDINHTVFASPAKASRVTWGVGPSLTFPSSTADRLGTRKWSAGPSAVVLGMPGSFVVGSLVRQLWSYAGDKDRQDVSQLLIQPFVNYNMPNGWYLVTSPIITANWKADSGNRWTVPVGGGVGRLFRIGPQPINAQFQGFYNAARPRFGPDWSLRVQVQLLFPKGKPAAAAAPVENP